MEEGFSEAVVDGMTGFTFTNRFGTIHNPQAVNRAIKRIYETHNAEEIVKAKNENREPVIIGSTAKVQQIPFFAYCIALNNTSKEITGILDNTEVYSIAP